MLLGIRVSTSHGSTLMLKVVATLIVAEYATVTVAT
jgi:hypothetical protein